MKYHLLTLAFLIGCTSVPNDPSETQKKEEIVEQQNDYKNILSPKSTYTLHYKVQDEKNSPVRRFTYYVTNTASKQISRKSETVAAEKIYWKNDQTLAIIPYVEVMQQSTEVGVPPQSQEILITIK